MKSVAPWEGWVTQGSLGDVPKKQEAGMTISEIPPRVRAPPRTPQESQTRQTIREAAAEREGTQVPDISNWPPVVHVKSCSDFFFNGLYCQYLKNNVKFLISPFTKGIKAFLNQKTKYPTLGVLKKDL